MCFLVGRWEDMRERIKDVRKYENIRFVFLISFFNLSFWIFKNGNNSKLLNLHNQHATSANSTDKFKWETKSERFSNVRDEI